MSKGFISNNWVLHKYSFNIKNILFQTIQISIQVVPFQTRVDQGAIAMKAYTAFPKVPELLELHDQIV